MASSSYAILTLGVTLTAAATKYRAVSDTGGLPAAAARCLGFPIQDGVIGDRLPVVVTGTVIAEAGAAIAAGAAVELDALGRVITRSAGVIVGRLAPGSVAAASGDTVEIMLLPS